MKKFLSLILILAFVMAPIRLSAYPYSGSSLGLALQMIKFSLPEWMRSAITAKPAVTLYDLNFFGQLVSQGLGYESQFDQ